MRREFGIMMFVVLHLLQKQPCEYCGNRRWGEEEASYSLAGCGQATIIQFIVINLSVDPMMVCYVD